MSQFLELRKIAKEKAGQMREISRKRRPISFKWINSEWKARILALDSSRDNLSDLTIDWGGAKGCFRFDQSWLAQILKASFGMAEVGIVQDQWKMILFESALQKFFRRLKNQLENDL